MPITDTFLVAVVESLVDLLRSRTILAQSQQSLVIQLTVQ